jgi:hypothetical protein
VVFLNAARRTLTRIDFLKPSRLAP